jgi:glycogen debranching enzyme
LQLTILDGSTFCVCDERGDVDGLATASGFFASDTRFLSRSVLTLGGARLDPLSHDHSRPHLASFVLRNPLAAGLQPNELVIKRERFVGGCMEERIMIENLAHRRIDAELGLELGADFADIFVVKNREPAFGQRVDETLPPARPAERAAAGTILFSDDSLPGRTVVHLSQPFDYSGGVARFALSLEPDARWRLVVGVQPDLEGVEPLSAASFVRELDEKRHSAEREMAEWQQTAPALSAGWDDLVRTWNRSLADLASLRMRVTEISDAYLLAAGTPWFMTVFGRDTIISSLQTLLLGPELAAGTLRVLAATQATLDDPDRDAEPGKIIHELRRGKAAHAWFDRYYGSLDATPLFLVLLSELWRWTDEPLHPLELEEAARAALAWIDTSADLDGDGLAEFERRCSHGLRNQTWKDSEDSMAFHDGTPPRTPIAPAEVQGYIYDAKLRMAEIAREIWRDEALAGRLESDAVELRRRFDDAFWVEERGFYALGLDWDKRPIDSLTSNVGHLLWSRIVNGQRAEAVADLLMHDDLWSGWGVRTMAAGEGAYNPLAYHNGTVWPHDNSLVAWGLARSGRRHDAARILQATVEAASHFDYRLPEVFAGFARSDTRFPVAYPTASSPQAWAAGAPVLLLQLALGLVPDRKKRVLRSEAEAVPECLEGLALEGIQAFGQRWTVRVESGVVELEPVSRC